MEANIPSIKEWQIPIFDLLLVRCLENLNKHIPTNVAILWVGLGVNVGK